MKNLVYCNGKTKIIISIILATVIFISAIFFVEYKKAEDYITGIYDLKAHTKDSCISLNWNTVKKPSDSQIELTITSDEGEEVILLDPKAQAFDFSDGKHGTYYSFSLCIKKDNNYIGEPAEAKAMYIKTQALDGLPLLKIDTYNGQDPTTDLLYPPEGAVGITSTNNEYVYGSLTLEEKGETELQSNMQIKIRGNATSSLSEKSPIKSSLIILKICFSLKAKMKLTKNGYCSPTEKM